MVILLSKPAVIYIFFDLFIIHICCVVHMGPSDRQYWELSYHKLSMNFKHFLISNIHRIPRFFAFWLSLPSNSDNIFNDANFRLDAAHESDYLCFHYLPKIIFNDIPTFIKHFFKSWKAFTGAHFDLWLYKSPNWREDPMQACFGFVCMF